MKEHLGSPKFDAKQYERPVQKWVCGHAEGGEPCRLGPSPRGSCQATCECTPVLELKPGETKGRYRCTRPNSLGGPCEQGPLPEGKCSRTLLRCTPVRSLRAKRGLLTLYVTAGTAGVLLMLLGGPWRTSFVNPGPLSANHTGPGFTKLTPMTNAAECAGCHGTAAHGVSEWVNAAFKASPGPFDLKGLSAQHPPNLGVIEANCRRCHEGHNFHSPSIELAENSSCSSCHREHIGGGPMKPTDWAQCMGCHGSPDRMTHFAEVGKTKPASDFARVMSVGLNLFPAPRPVMGRTAPFKSFEDHPEFQVSRTGPGEEMRETNRLRFNHAFHLNTNNLKVKLECSQCHQADASGAFHRKLSFANSCQECHKVQFDFNNPELVLPHGNPAHVRAFLRSLPTQYANYVTRTRGPMDQASLDNYVREQMNGIRQQAGSGELLEEKVFFSDKRWAPAEKFGRLSDTGRSMFYGCAYCHEVNRAGDAVPVITPVFIPDRWMQHSTFNHAKHTAVACIDCHRVEKSQDTADVLMPVRDDCVKCHSPKGGVSYACATCHDYHRRDPRESLTTIITRADAK